MARTIMSSLAAISQNTRSDNIRMIDISELHDSPHNFFRMENVPELAEAILAQGGVKDNLLVTPMESGGYEIISGHRRKAAVQYLLDQGESISRFLPCLVQSYASESLKVMDLVLCNATTRQLSDQELWQSYEALEQSLEEQRKAGVKLGKTRDQLAGKLQISSSQVSKLKHISNSAEPEIQEAVASGVLSVNTANEIAKLEPEQQQELAQGDLSKVTPKVIREAAESGGAASPRTVEWNEKTELVIVKQHLMHLVTDQLREKALVMKTMDFRSEFRKLCQRNHQNDTITIMPGVKMQFGFEKIFILFLNPAEHDNIEKIAMKYFVAARKVQDWLKEEAAYLNSQGDRPVTPDMTDADTVPLADDQDEGDRPVTLPEDTDRSKTQDSAVLLKYAGMPESELNSIFNTGCFNEITLGYLTLTLQAMGMQSGTVLAAQKAMNSIFDKYNSAAARKAYKES